MGSSKVAVEINSAENLTRATRPFYLPFYITFNGSSRNISARATTLQAEDAGECSVHQAYRPRKSSFQVSAYSGLTPTSLPELCRFPLASTTSGDAQVIASLSRLYQQP